MDAVYGGRFVGGNAEVRKFWWHKMGQIAEQPVTAGEAWEMMGKYGVIKTPSYIDYGGNMYPTGRFNIVRVPVMDGTAKADTLMPVSFGEVKGGYEVIDPQTVIETLDRATGGRHIHTMGALRDGQDLFVTYKMPTYGVKDSEIQPFGVVHSPYSGEAALRIMTTSVCVVCWNTLNAAAKDSTMKLSIKHDTNVAKRFETWTTGILSFIDGKIERQQKVFMAMANKKLTAKQVDALIETLVPLPKAITKIEMADELSVAVDAKREKFDTARVNMALKDREIVRRLFDGEGTGMDLEANRGTVFGLLNAYTEMEDHTGNELKDNEEGRNSIADRLFGQAANMKAKGYATLAAFAGIK